MAQEYAKDQPAGFVNRIERVAIVGAGGNVGKPITQALLATGKHTITALTRSGSTALLPEGVKIAEIDYDNEETIVTALKGQQYLIITMSVMAPPDNHHKLVTAAAKAGVPYVMPNLYGRVILDNEEMNKSTLVGPTYATGIRDIEAQGISKWTGMSCSFWYEWSLTGGPFFFGFDIPSKRATFYHDGLTKITTTTHPQCGRAVSSLLSLPILPTSPTSDPYPTLSQWFNAQLKISSFFISQREMLNSIQRVTGSSDAEWTIEYADPAETHKHGLEMLAAGGPNARVGFGKALYSRIFMKDATFRSDEGNVNEVLGLPREDLDEATRKALGLGGEVMETLKGYNEVH